MKKSILQLLLVSITLFLFAGCASKDDKEYNKPALYWYNKMIQQISNYNLDGADDTFTSLESEHRNSPFIPTSLMILATAHMEDEQYEMANYYLDEYLKRYSLKNDTDYIRFLKIKSNFLAFKNQYREQNLLDITIKETQQFLEQYPDSQYIHLVNTIQSRLLMTKALFDQEIARLYERVDKPIAQKYYEEKASQNWKTPEDIQDIKVPWYRAIFE